MTGLVLKLKPHEKFLVNGVVLQNGDRTSRLRVRTAGASVLRLRDAMHPEEAVTPLKRIYYVAQLAVAGAADEAAARAEMLDRLGTAHAEAATDEARAAIAAAGEAVRAGKLFAAMRTLRTLFAGDAAPPAPEG